MALLRSRYLRLATYGTVVALSVHFLTLLLLPPNSPAAGFIQVSVAAVALGALMGIVLADYRRGGSLMKRIEEEVLVIAIFGLFWLSFVTILRVFGRQASIPIPGLGATAAASGNSASAQPEQQPQPQTFTGRDGTATVVAPGSRTTYEATKEESPLRGVKSYLVVGDEYVIPHEYFHQHHHHHHHAKGAAGEQGRVVTTQTTTQTLAKPQWTPPFAQQQQGQQVPPQPQQVPPQPAPPQPQSQQQQYPPYSQQQQYRAPYQQQQYQPPYQQQQQQQQQAQQQQQQQPGQQQSPYGMPDSQQYQYQAPPRRTIRRMVRPQDQQYRQPYPPYTYRQAQPKPEPGQQPMRDEL